MSKPESTYMRYNMDNTIQIIQSQIDLINRRTDLYDPQYFPQDSEDFSHKSSHIIGEFVPIKEPHDFLYGFKSQCPSINEPFSKLEGCLNSRQNNKSRKFPPLGNELLPPSKNITMKNYHVMYLMKQKDLCFYYLRCIMSRGLMFYNIIMVIIRNN